MEKEKKIILNCKSCGAALKVEEKQCSYCGTANVNYGQQDANNKNQNSQPQVSVDFGSFLGGKVISDMLKKISGIFD